MTKDRIFNTWNRRNKNKDLFKRKETYNTFYGRIRLDKWSKQFHWVHYKLKYKIIVPAIKLVYKWSKKKLQPIPKEPQYKYLRLWDEIFDTATIKWRNTYLNPAKGQKGHLTLEQLKTQYQGDTNLGMMRKIKEIINTVMINDDAYTEWLPFFLWETTNRMNKEKANLQETDGKIYHLLHNVGTDGVMDAQQEIIYLKLIRQQNFAAIISGNQGGEKK